VRRGYTLIETTVVLLVLALAAGVAAPAIGRGLDAIRLRTEVAGVASFLRAARERAITQRHALDVRIDEAGRTLTLNAGDEGVRAVRHLSVLHIEADPRAAARSVTFFAYGLSTGGRFRLEAPGPVVYVVTVSPLTGGVSTRRGDS
jgi:prepilin-type N-terminal cleavage/methylation domain-containing protein